jgi:hypothetical protein
MNSYNSDSLGPSAAHHENTDLCYRSSHSFRDNIAVTPSLPQQTALILCLKPVKGDLHPIDFSRKPKSEREEPGVTYEGSRSYRESLTARSKRNPTPVTESQGGRTYLTQPELTELLSKQLSRQFSEFESAQIAKFFVSNAPIFTAQAEEALELAVSAKGHAMNLRFYFHSIEQQLNKQRS